LAAQLTGNVSQTETVREGNPAHAGYGMITPGVSEEPTFLLLEDRTLFRFVSARWFEEQPDRFFLNFLDSKRTFEARHRLSGPDNSCGFYFSPSIEVAMMETMFYNRIDIVGSRDPMALLKHRGMAPSVLLECTVRDVKVLNLTDEQNAEWLITKYELFDDDDRDWWDALDYFALYCDPAPGGGEYADLMGWFAARDGYVGVAFPSRRALDCADETLWCDTQFWRYTGDEAFHVRRNDEINSSDIVLWQMQAEFNIVLYRGSNVTRSIVSYAVLRPDGRRTVFSNPYFKLDRRVVQEARIHEAERLALSPEEADDLGLVHDVELDAMYLSKAHRGKRNTARARYAR